MRIRPSFLGPSLTFDDVRSRPRNFRDPGVLPERRSSLALGVRGPLRAWRTDFLFEYRVFPDTILRYEAEWMRAGRGPEVGDVILQHAFLPPLGFGVRLEFAVRICALIREDTRLGFAYETLDGHAESGVSTFVFEERDGSLFFTIHTFSEPGHWTSRIGKHVVTLPYQQWCTNRALENVRRLFLARNPGAVGQAGRAIAG